jgi:predicted porin
MTRFTKLAAAAFIATTPLAGAAFAGNLDDAIVEAPVIAPAPAPVYSSDWTGFYSGLQFGYADIDSATGALGGNNELFGLHAGYDYDFGSYVIGAEFDYDQADIDLGGGAANIDTIARLKFKAGYDFGGALLYATAGAARADTSVGNETAPFIGVGLNYKVTDSFTVGGELLEHRFDDVAGVAGNDLDATTFTIRGGFRF